MDRKIHLNISYHHCGKKGYYKSYYPTKEEEEEEEYEEIQILHVPDDTYLTNDSDTSSKGYDVSLLCAFYLMSKFKG